MRRKAINHLVAILDAKKAELRGTPEYPEFVEQVVAIMGLFTQEQERNDRIALMANRINAALYSVQDRMSHLPEKLIAAKCPEIDFCEDIEPLITANYVLSAIINELDHDACSRL